MGKPGERQARLVGDARGVNRCQKWLGPAAIDTTLASLGKQEIRSWSASPSSARPGRQGPNRAAPRQQATSCSAAGHAAPPAPPTRTRVHRGEAARVAVRARVGQHCGDEGDGAAGGGGGGAEQAGGRPAFTRRAAPAAAALCSLASPARLLSTVHAQRGCVQLCCLLLIDRGHHRTHRSRWDQAIVSMNLAAMPKPL